MFILFLHLRIRLLPSFRGLYRTSGPPMLRKSSLPSSGIRRRMTSHFVNCLMMLRTVPETKLWYIEKHFGWFHLDKDYVPGTQYSEANSYSPSSASCLLPMRLVRPLEYAAPTYDLPPHMPIRRSISTITHHLTQRVPKSALRMQRPNFGTPKQTGIVPLSLSD
jgi:hypothetical protein